MIPHRLIAISCILISLAGNTQNAIDTSVTANHPFFAGKDLFASDVPLEIKLKGNISDLLNDRTGEPKYFPLSLTYRQDDSSELSIPVNIKQRGHFRRSKANCFYPPLLIQFTQNDKQSSSIFPAKAKLKLVMPCTGDEFVVREWLVYKIYNLVTPESFRGRLVRVVLENEKTKKETAPFFGILLEEDQQVAKRNNAVVVNHKIKPQQAMQDAFLRMATFEYLIGNIDWSVEYLQNIKLIGRDSTSTPRAIPYDFDYAGIVNAPYAQPAEQLEMQSVRERRYRGYCIQDMALFDSTIACYNRLKNEIYSLYTNCTLLDAKYIKATIKYLDEFYSTINNPKAFKKDFGYPCDKNGTGNVIIKGLKEE